LAAGWASLKGAGGGPLTTRAPQGTYWTACFNVLDPVVDVDIVLPVQWIGDVLEEVDLELDILRSTDGTVHVRDQEEFDHVREAWAMPDAVAQQAEGTCWRIRDLVERGEEPFGDVGQVWLSRFLTDAGEARS
jgi:hypothetical protein